MQEKLNYFEEKTNSMLLTKLTMDPPKTMQYGEIKREENDYIPRV